MNIDIEQMQQIVALMQCMNGETAKTNEIESTPMLRGFIGKYVICRSRNEGINAGYVQDIDETGVVLKDARRLWFHKASNNASWYEGVANNGISDESKVSEKTTKIIIEGFSLTLCSDKGRDSIEQASSHEG